LRKETSHGPDLTAALGCFLPPCVLRSGLPHNGHGASVPPAPGAVRDAIEGNLARFSDAMTRADAHATASMFTEDGVYIVSATNGFTTGRAAIEELFAARFKAARFIEVAIATASVQVEGDMAYETGTNSLTVQAGTRLRPRAPVGT